MYHHLLLFAAVAAVSHAHVLYRECHNSMECVCVVLLVCVVVVGDCVCVVLLVCAAVVGDCVCVVLLVCAAVVGDCVCVVLLVCAVVVEDCVCVCVCVCVRVHALTAVMPDLGPSATTVYSTLNGEQHTSICIVYALYVPLAIYCRTTCIYMTCMYLWPSTVELHVYI